MEICGLYYKPMMIINYDSSVVNKLETLLTENARVVIYDRRIFIVQATGRLDIHQPSYKILPLQIKNCAR
jgi:hypothetical protein